MADIDDFLERERERMAEREREEKRKANNIRLTPYPWEAPKPSKPGEPITLGGPKPKQKPRKPTKITLKD